jgi:sugar phosphate isomerase/epimerase
MRIGVAEGPVPYDLDLVDERLAAKLAELGFTGIFAHFGYGQEVEPAALDRGKCRQARDVLAAYGVRVAQAWAWSPNLVHPDDAVRASEVGRLRAALEVAAELGADGVTGGCGSRNPRGGYWPHRENHTADAQACLVRSLQEAAPAAESLGLRIALECHVLTTLDSPERVREILDAVDSPAVGVNLDPVNFIGDLDTLYDSAGLLDRVFDCLGRYAVCGHVKDVYAEDRLVLHLSETLLGDGEFDLRSYVMRFEELLPDGYLFIEHLPEDLVPRAKSVLDTLLGDLAIHVRAA